MSLPLTSTIEKTRTSWGSKWRTSFWFATFVVGFGFTNDLLVYSIIITVIPFHLQDLGYHNISSLVGWLFFAYQGTFAIAAIPIAMLSERYSIRRLPLIVGVLALLGSQILLMEAPAYWVMCLSRILHGISSSVVWTLGIALLSDMTPEAHTGRQVGIATAGLSLGQLIGPPVGGALYTHFGYRALFIFSEVCTVVDLIGRLLVIERKEVNPTPLPDPDTEEPIIPDTLTRMTLEVGSNLLISASADHHESPLNTIPLWTVQPVLIPNEEHIPSEDSTAVVHNETLSLPAVLVKLFRSPRALAALWISLTHAFIDSSRDTVLPLHMQSVWDFNSSEVGLVFLAAFLPTLLSSPLTGWFADIRGTEWITLLSLLSAVPWLIIMIIQTSLPLFIASYAISSFLSASLSPLVDIELAEVSRGISGIGYAHVYGVCNLAYGIGASIGPVTAGQLYDHIRYGWATVCSLAAGTTVVCIILAFSCIGAEPLFAKTRRNLESRVITQGSS